MKKRLLSIILSLSLSIPIAQGAISEGAKMEVTPELIKQYKEVTLSLNVIRALEFLKETDGEYSREAVLGKNLTSRPIKIEFLDLSKLNPLYKDFDALGWKKKERLYIYINQKHNNAPPEALSAIIAHEAIHQDEHNSLNEETYAWTMEASVWTTLTEENPALELIDHPLVERENTIKKMFKSGDYTSRRIHGFVVNNPGYHNLPETSPGFEQLR